MREPVQESVPLAAQFSETKRRASESQTALSFRSPQLLFAPATFQVARGPSTRSARGGGLDPVEFTPTTRKDEPTSADEYGLHVKGVLKSADGRWLAMVATDNGTQLVREGETIVVRHNGRPESRRVTQISSQSVYLAPRHE